MKTLTEYLSTKVDMTPSETLRNDFTLDELVQFLEDKGFEDKSGITSNFVFSTDIDRYRTSIVSLSDVVKVVEFCKKGKVTKDNPIFVIVFDRNGSQIVDLSEIDLHSVGRIYDLSGNEEDIKTFFNYEEILNEINEQFGLE